MLDLLEGRGFAFDYNEGQGMDPNRCEGQTIPIPLEGGNRESAKVEVEVSLIFQHQHSNITICVKTTMYMLAPMQRTVRRSPL